MPASSAFDGDYKVHLVILIQLGIPDNYISLVISPLWWTRSFIILQVCIWLQGIYKHISLIYIYIQ